MVILINYLDFVIFFRLACTPRLLLSNHSMTVPLVCWCINLYGETNKLEQVHKHPVLKLVTCEIGKYSYCSWSTCTLKCCIRITIWRFWRLLCFSPESSFLFLSFPSLSFPPNHFSLPFISLNFTTKRLITRQDVVHFVSLLIHYTQSMNTV